MSVEMLRPDGVSPPVGMYSHACRVEAGAMLYVAGQVAVDEHGGLVGRDDFKVQMRQVFHNLERVLSAGGSGFDRVLKMTTFLVHSQDISKFYEERAELFKEIYPAGDYPPNTLVVIDRLVSEDYLLEIEAVAAV